MRLLDTSVLAKWGDPAEKDAVVPYLQAHADEPFVTSSLVVFEFFRPARRRNNSQQVHEWLDTALDDVRPFSPAAGEMAAAVEARLERHDQQLPMRDLLIATHARALDATLVTCDRGDFEDEVVQQLLDVDVVT